METIAEIQDMRVTELKDFLRRHDVNIASIARSDGTNGPPRKSDLLSAALDLRADYENPQPSGPTSPKTPRNIFQSGYSPQSSRTLRATEAEESSSSPRLRSDTAGDVADMESARKRSSTRAPASNDEATPFRQKKLKPRRRSSGWINPAFNPALTPKSGASSSSATPRKAFTRARPTRVPEDDNVAEVPKGDFGDEGDQVIASDYDSSGSAISGGESDGGSVIETDDDEETSNQFKSMKVYEIRAWLNEHDVTFNHRSKKAELISLATAHALYLENIASAAKDQAKPKPVVSRELDDDETTAFVEDEIEKVAQRPVVAEKLLSGKPVETKPVGQPNAVERPNAVENLKKANIVAAHGKEDKTRRRSRSRVIAAPLPDDDNDIDVEKNKDEIVPVVKSKRKKRHSKRERSPVKSVWPLFRIPVPSMPSVTITRRGVTFFAAFILLVMLVVSSVNIWAKSKWPFCDTGAEQGIMADGSECHPCPNNGWCENGKLTCLEGYFQSGHQCRKDEEVGRYADHLERKILRLLTWVKGKYQCGERSSAGLSEDEIRDSVDPTPKDALRGKRKPRKLKFDPSKFNAAFILAMESIRTNREDEIDHKVLSVGTKLDNEVEDKMLSVSTNRELEVHTYEAREGNRSLRCICRQFLWQHIGYVIMLLALCLAFARWRIKRFFRQREEARVEELYEAALEVLREVRVNFVGDDKGDAFMIDTQLREDLLGRTTNEKVKLWVKVEELLRADSRVLRSGPRSIKGMPCYVYEWRGNLRRPSLTGSGRDGFRAYSGPDSESRRRLSFGSGSRRHSGVYDGSPVTGTTGSPFGRRPSLSPRTPAASPGYRNMLNFWNQ